MPVYLCKPGHGSEEPWRLGLQVYNDPFPIPTNDNDIQTNDQQLQSDNNNRNDNNTNLGQSLRRVRHTEVVLVDEVSIWYNRYWLRLRWPGPEGGFAGYIPILDKNVKEQDMKSGPVCPVCPDNENDSNNLYKDTPDPEMIRKAQLSPPHELHELVPIQDDDMEDENDVYDDDDDDDETNILTHDATSNFVESTICSSTGIIYPTSNVMELLPSYQDGFSLQTSHNNTNKDFVFCRICREGIHDIDTTTNTNTTNPPPSHPSAENPLLAPCKCTGSMAFVHYLCIEQWRCRSRHPSAKEGLNCETCGSPYSLPPPPVRQLDTISPEGEDLPHHVIAALRHPPLGWQLISALVRRKYLRPLAPIVMSPMVALYCKARRILKKRGVSRRRWACSLCRRRARWKCVRCLRSYYCSRQCQNISWHIVHKHVCYKPTRYAWSGIVYGIFLTYFFPGLWKDPIVYWVGLAMIPYNFLVLGVIAGFLATCVKKVSKVDLRGRALELLVVLATMGLSYLTWGLSRGFTVSSSHCHGVIPDLMTSIIPHFGNERLVNMYIRNPFFFLFQSNIRRMDQWFTSLSYTHRIYTKICTFPPSSPKTCFAITQTTNPYFLSEEPKCLQDSLLFFSLVFLGHAILIGVWMNKRGGGGDRNQRMADQHGRRRVNFAPPVHGAGVQRPHQD